MPALIIIKILAIAAVVTVGLVCSKAVQQWAVSRIDENSNLLPKKR